jgi:hypothetical protein
MGGMTNILVKDDTITTPVEFTLIPITDTPNPFWRAAVANVPLDGQMRLNVTTEQQRNGSWKFTVKLEVPVMETLGASGTSAGYVAPPKVAYVNTGIFSMFADARSTVGDRANLLKLLVGCIQGASSTTATGILSNTAAGDAWKSSVLPIPLLFTQGILPS